MSLKNTKLVINGWDQCEWLPSQSLMGDKKHTFWYTQDRQNNMSQWHLSAASIELFAEQYELNIKSRKRKQFCSLCLYACIFLLQIFFPETTDIYDRKNMPRAIYCIHALRWDSALVHHRVSVIGISYHFMNCATFLRQKHA